MNSVAKVKFLETLTGNDKINFIRDNKDDEHFMFILKVATDPFVVTNIKQLPKVPSRNFLIPYQDRFEEFKSLVRYLETHPRSSKTEEEVKKFLSKCSDLEIDVYGQAITKSLRVGVGTKMLNKAVPGTVTEFELMKAYPINSVGKISFPIGVEEKYDGVRCAIFYEKGKPLYAKTYRGHSIELPTIFKAAQKVFDKLEGDGWVLDGEILHETRTKTSGAVNKILKADWVKADADADLSFVAFDLLPLEEFVTKEFTEPYVDRQMRLLFTIPPKGKKIRPANAWVAHSMDEVEALFKKIEAEGGEGVVLKTLYGVYECKRSKEWVKLKGLYSTTLEVVGLKPGKGKFVGMLGAFLCKTADGKLEVEVGGGLTEHDRVVYNTEEVVGRLIEVAFNGAHKDKNGKVFIDFPVFKGFREDKEEADTLQDLLNEIPKGGKR